MNRKLLIGITLLAVVAVLWLLWRTPAVQSLLVSDEAGVRAADTLEARLKEAEQKKGAPLTEDEKKALLPKQLKHLYETASTMGVVPVSFYARVVDQYGEPVSGAYFRASVMGSMLGNYTPGSGHTSASGGFRIEAKGSDITIMALQKPGYVFTATDCYGKHTCAFSAQDTFYAAKTAPHQKTWEDHQTAETAYTFKMHKLGYVEGVYAERVSLIPPGINQWQTFRFGADEKRSDEPDFPGHIRARLLDRSDDNWKIEIQAVNGGIQLAPKDDAYMSIAPQSGYQETFVFECKRDGNCNQGNDRRFYFYSNGGKEYGAMVVTIGRRVEGFYRINTKGNRDLNMSSLEQFNLNRWGVH